MSVLEARGISLRDARLVLQRTTPHVHLTASNSYIEPIAAASTVGHLVECKRLRDRTVFYGSWTYSDQEGGHSIEFDEAPCQGWIAQHLLSWGAGRAAVASTERKRDLGH